MPSPRFLFRLTLIALATHVSMAAAATTRPSVVTPVSRAGAWRNENPARAVAFEQFEARHSRWTVVRDHATGRPYQAFGPGIHLDGFANDAASTDAGVRRFIAENPEVFGSRPNLETMSAMKAGNLWYVHFRQTVDNVPVLFEDWAFSVSGNGRLVGFGTDVHEVPEGVRTTPAIGGSVAREAAKLGVPFDPVRDRVEGGTDLYLFPRRTPAGTEFRLVYDVRVKTMQPRANWITLVDAASGDVLWRHNHIFYANISGTVTGSVHLPTGATATRNFPNLKVNVGATQAVTNGVGDYSAVCPGSSTVTAKLSGPYCHVTRLDVVDSDALFSRTNVGCPSDRDIAWDNSNSDFAQRDAYYHANVAHDYIKAFHPAYTGNDNDLAIGVNSLNDDECEAYWDGVSLTFGIGGTTCVNMATLPDVMYHEYHHRVNDQLYFDQGAPFGLTNQALHEGLAHAFAAFQTDDPVIGNGVLTGQPSSFIRTINVDNRWPEDQSVDANEAGMILAGALWDVRESIGLGPTQAIAHFARYRRGDNFPPPDSPDNGVAMSKFFIGMLMAIDNDGDLSNGTPFFNEITGAFNAHGIGTNFFIDVVHNPILDSPTGGPFPVTAVIQYSGPVGSLTPGSPTLHYQVRNLPWTSQPMVPTGNPDEFGAEIPAQSGAVVRYYITAGETNGGTRAEPFGAPSSEVYAFIAGPASVLIADELEAPSGWTVGASGDNATTGIWVRGDPRGTLLRAARGRPHHERHQLLSHRQCGFQRGRRRRRRRRQDHLGVPGLRRHRRRLLTYPIISYYRWYSNNAGEAPGADTWQVQISNNGGAAGPRSRTPRRPTKLGAGCCS